MAARAIGAVFWRNWLKVSPREDPIMMFVGSPTMVAMPPMFAARTSAITKGTGSMSSPSNTSTVSGTMKSATVTMSSREAIPAVMRGRRTYMRMGWASTDLARCSPIHSKNPASRSDDAMMNIPSKTPRACQLIAEARSDSVRTPVPTIRVAPRTAAEGLWNLSERMRM